MADSKEIGYNLTVPVWMTERYLELLQDMLDTVDGDTSAEQKRQDWYTGLVSVDQRIFDVHNAAMLDGGIEHIREAVDAVVRALIENAS